MSNTEILDGLEALFCDDESVGIRRGPGSISFVQWFHNVPRVGGDAFRNYNRRYTHTIRLLDGAYKAEDLIETFNLGENNPRTGYKRGNLHDEGYHFKDGEQCVWSTEYIKRPVKLFMDQTGLKIKEPFWTGKRIAVLFAVIWIPILIAAAVLLISG